MLIQCPECGKQISDKADSCPNCGCPVNKMNYDNYCSINDVKYDLTDAINVLSKVDNKDTDVHPLFVIEEMIRNKTSLERESAKKLALIILKTNKIPPDFNGKIDTYKTTQAQLNIPKCPTCGSTNIEEIGGLERVASVVVWGLSSKKINKTFKCKNCGYTW